MKMENVLTGFAIIIVDRGYHFVGYITHDGQWCVVTDAMNIRKWGTTRGLGELALHGPRDATVLDSVGTIRVPAHAVIGLIETEPAKWKQ